MPRATRLSRLVAAAAATVVLVTVTACGHGTSKTPSVSSVTPSNGSILGGTPVTITGSNFRACGAAVVVGFGGDPSYDGPIVATKVTVVSDTEIHAVSPASYPGPVQVQVGTRCGYSSPSDAGNFAVTDQGAGECTTGTCEVTVSDKTIGPITHVASGFLNGYTGTVPTVTASRLTALKPKSWRYSVAPPALRRAFAPSHPLTIGLLESSWLTCTSCGNVRQPWSDPATFASYYTQAVRSAIGAGTAPTYWDVWNEPDGSGTVGQWLTTFDAAFHAIKAADPTAKIVGPDIARFSLAKAPGPSSPGTLLDLRTFLDFAASHHLKFAALAYHDFGAPSGGADQNPQDLATHVRLARAAIAAHTTLAPMKLFVDEYGPYIAASEPGWLVGMMAALEAAQPDQASLACDGDVACFDTVNGLLGTDGTPQMPYWVYAEYAAMTGQRLTSTSPATNFSTLASRQPDGSLVALVGRHDACGTTPLPHLHASAPASSCPSFRAPTHAPVTLTISLPMPSGSGPAAVAVQRLANTARAAVGQNPVPIAPASQPIDAATRNGMLVVTVPAIGDGDAIRLTVARASSRSASR